MSLHLLALFKEFFLFFFFFPLQAVTLHVLLLPLHQIETFTSQGVYEEQLLRPNFLLLASLTQSNTKTLTDKNDGIYITKV